MEQVHQMRRQSHRQYLHYADVRGGGGPINPVRPWDLYPKHRVLSLHSTFFV